VPQSRGAAEQSSPRHSSQPTNLQPGNTSRASQPRTVNHRRHPHPTRASTSIHRFIAQPTPSPPSINYLLLQSPLQLRAPTFKMTDAWYAALRPTSSPQNTPSSPLPQSPTPTPTPPPLRQHIYRTASTMRYGLRGCLANNAVSAALFTRLVPSPPCRNRQSARGDDVGSDVGLRPDRNRTHKHINTRTFSY
jgi:hypothetical protein